MRRITACSWKLEAVISYFLSLSLKKFNNKSAKAINDPIIKNNSVRVMYSIYHPPFLVVKGVEICSLPKREATATVYGVLRISCDTVNIISHLSEYVNLKKHAELHFAIPRVFHMLIIASRTFSAIISASWSAQVFRYLPRLSFPPPVKTRIPLQPALCARTISFFPISPIT